MIDEPDEAPAARDHALYSASCQMTVSQRGEVVERKDEGDETEEERLLRSMIVREVYDQKRRGPPVTPPDGFG